MSEAALSAAIWECCSGLRAELCLQTGPAWLRSLGIAKGKERHDQQLTQTLGLSHSPFEATKVPVFLRVTFSPARGE